MALYYDAKEQHTLSDDLVSALKEAEIPVASLVHFGWMFHGTEMTGEHKEIFFKTGSPGNLGPICERRKEVENVESFRISTMSHNIWTCRDKINQNLSKNCTSAWRTTETDNIRGRIVRIY